MFDFTIDYESFSYNRYVNYRFLLFLSELKVTKLPFLTTCIPNNSLSFLGRKIFRDARKLHTSVCEKSTFSGALTDFEFFYKFFENVIFFPLSCIMS